ncbi:penicillin-insensitive murein endopeptidase [Thiococcus pfennigii]|jgi:penicillin-insensitive murein endopeptidase|uniref:penicillin-insensitive murein endopeptidase n=1 Tax=Thiococcus pfennigii TaxID=1057 RepID=UPI0019039064|nr:penicillin-insensitive murein endopeptidase [Thiococcus pfennigii]MBK1702292.1 penicillin-insensitive murein endopeptidase [Thiococcus pfennigii]MBK1733424.1 penicillin-insensitive murein endopeptidase [Thiococcus pfennigii]
MPSPVLRPGRAVGLAFLLAALAGTAALANPWPTFTDPAPGPTRAIGAAANGCLAGAAALPAAGHGFVSIRRERNRFYGHPVLIEFVTDLAARLAYQTDRLLMIGDLAQPRGGRMASSHASHQNGLDVDVWFRLATSPDQARRETADGRDPPSMVERDGLTLTPEWGPEQRLLLKSAAEDWRVERIFVNPAIKRALCEREAGERAWLRKVRPWYKHDAHFHVRLRCPADSPACIQQPALPPGDGCDATLAWWFSEEARRPAKAEPSAPAPMPSACRALLEAG